MSHRPKLCYHINMKGRCSDEHAPDMHSLEWDCPGCDEFQDWVYKVWEATPPHPDEAKEDGDDD